MTGFGCAVIRPEHAPALTLTLRSINHRFLDVQLRLPAGAEFMEARLRAQLKAALGRGHIDCTLTVERTAENRSPTLTFHRGALRRYVDEFRAAAAELGLAAEPDLNVAAQLPGILLTAKGTAEADSDLLLEPLLERELPGLLEQALTALQAMRAREGAALAEVLRTSLDRLAAQVDEVLQLRATTQPAAFERLIERFTALLGSAVDRDRLLTEAALIAERGDVEEEAARLQTHIGHFHALLVGGGETGKQLDFLLQEMNREANTLLSKTGGAGTGNLRITECGLAMKAEIEKLREQVQNLE